MFRKIQFARTPCYGTCPVFDAEVTYDGTVKWNGHLHVSQIGEEEFKITKKKIEKIETLLNEFEFRSFTYPEPDMYATDHPSCITRVEYADGFVKEVDHYLGDFETHHNGGKHTLSNLEKFEKRIESIIGLRKYIKPTLYLYHLIVKEEEYVVSAPNEKDALKLIGNMFMSDECRIKKIGRDTTGRALPYIVLEGK